jgi:hypothetical protein
MRSPGQGPPDDLDRSLALLAEDVTFPVTPDFGATFGSLPASSRQRRNVLPAPLRWFAVAAAALLVATVALPVTREAVADWFDIPGIRIEIGDEPGDPGPTVTAIGGSLLLGEETTLADAREQVGLPRLVPGGPLAGAQPEVYLTSYQGVPVVSLLYPAGEELPGIGTTGVGLLLMAIADDGSSTYLIAKRATGETRPVTVMVNGQEGLWIEGGVLTVDAGDPFWTYQRRSGNVLVWRQDGVTYRMESALPLAAALDIAESLAPVPDS